MVKFFHKKCCGACMTVGENMPTLTVIFIFAYLFVMVAYFFSETSGNHDRRKVNKIILASMFIIYAFIEMFHFHLWGGLFTICFIGMVFCYIGDVWLLWSFTKGGISFAIGNVILFIFENLFFYSQGLTFGDYWWFLLILAVPYGTFLYLWFSGWYIRGSKKFMKYIFPFYILTVSLHGTLAIAGLILLKPAPTNFLLCTGLILFMISDYFISLHKFKYLKSKAILRLNSGTYFTGLLLAALCYTFVR